VFSQVEGKDLIELWFNLTAHIATGKNINRFYPSIFSHRLYGWTENIYWDEDSILLKDFFRYSGYSRVFKINQLKESYFTRKVEKQYDLLKDNIRKLQPKQARGIISFTEPAFDMSDRLKCLDSLYIQKKTMTTYDSLIIFRNTEVYPKLLMDFLFLYELLEKFIEEKVRGEVFSCFLTSAFINFQQVPLTALLLRKYGITNWNGPFKKGLIEWKDKFEDPSCIEDIKLFWIKRVVKRTHKLLEEDGINLEMLIEGK